MWTTLEIVNIIISLSIPIMVAYLGYLFSLRLKLIDQKNDERHQQALELKKQEVDELERIHKARIEFSINRRFHGNQKKMNLVEFVVTINNKSLIRYEFQVIKLRVLGIKKDDDIEFWTATKKNNETGELIKKVTKRVKFPEKILEENIVPWNYIFVEPGVKQELTYATLIAENIHYILVSVEFYYDANTPHTAERMFELKVLPSKT